MEIGTNSKALATPSMVQPVTTTKLVSPQRGGIGLEIIPLLVQSFSVHVQVTIATTKLVDSSDKSVKEQVEHVDPSFYVFDSEMNLWNSYLLV